MELAGDILIGAPRATVWAGLNDPEVLVRCIPGCEAMEVTSPTERSARVMVKVGPVRARFTGHVRMADIRDGEGCTLHFEGSGGPAGMAKGHSAVDLSDEPGGTRLRYTVQASVGGKLGQVGGRMIDAAAKQMADQFFASFEALMAPAGAPVATPPDSSSTTADAAPANPGTTAAAQEAPSVGTTASPSPDPRGAAAVTAPPSIAAPSTAAPSTAAPSTAAPYTVRPPVPPAAAGGGEGTRVLWFALGALSTGFGVWIASWLFT